MEEQWWRRRIASCRRARSPWVSAPPSRSSTSVPFEARRGAAARWRDPLAGFGSFRAPVTEMAGGGNGTTRPPDKQILLALPQGSIAASRSGGGAHSADIDRRSTNRMAAETTDPAPPSPPPPVAPAAAPSRPRLSGFEQLDGRVKELTLSQAELLERIQKLKQEVQNWRSNVETQVKTCRNELQGLKKGLDSEVEQLKSSNNDTEQAWQTQDQVLKVATDASMEEQTATQA